MRRVQRCAYAVLVAALCVVVAPGQAQATPGPPAAPEYWFDTWHLTSLYARGATGRGITIGEIDTGVNAALPELRGRVLSGTDFGQHGNGQVDREVDGFGHGTAMASIMVARRGLLGITGMAPDARILPIAVPLDGTTDENRPDDLPGAIRYAADHGAKIISMSLGSQRTPSADSEPCPDDEQAAIYDALRKGSIVVAAVGNTGPSRNVVEEPGVCLGVVSVGALDQRGALASFSTRQPYLTLTAPGVAVPSLGRTAGQAYSGKGTSQATAIVSAALALVWSKFPALSGDQIVARMLATLDDRRATPSSTYGYGKLDTNQAVTAHVPANAPDPVAAAAAPFIARQKVLAHSGLGPAPRRATQQLPMGTFHVGSTSNADTELLIGLGMSIGGLILLVSLLAIGLVGPPRRRQFVGAAGPGQPRDDGGTGQPGPAA
ncbi:S8 family serine peptidase [uncultured Jatrophihabitans sp.]|uniref:S8 family peptidase n=1 Tax=uncultured Jatrophihabitans sp. TaxID=1610747 RepID=UPI0035CC4B97